MSEIDLILYRSSIEKARFWAYNGDTVADLLLEVTKFDALFDLFRVWAVATTVVATITPTTQKGQQ